MYREIKRIAIIYLVFLVAFMFVVNKIIQFSKSSEETLLIVISISRFIFIILNLFSVSFIIYNEKALQIEELYFSNYISYFKVFSNKLSACIMLTVVYLVVSLTFINYHIEIDFYSIVTIIISSIAYCMIYFQFTLLLYFFDVKLIYLLVVLILCTLILPSILQILMFSSNNLLVFIGEYNILVVLYDLLVSKLEFTRYIVIIVSYIVLLLLTKLVTKKYLD